MMKRTTIIFLILLMPVTLLAQKNQEGSLKREVTLYNPYKPSLPDVVKKSYLPDMTDTAGIKPQFTYHVRTYPFIPDYNITPVKPATLLPDPLPKLYNSFINIGFGSYITPLAEVSVTNQRSKKGSIGIYARHFSTNGNVELLNGKRAFAGYMDNDASLYGKKFLKKSVFSGSLDFIQRTRYAYGYDTSFTDYSPGKKEIRLNYIDAGAKIGLASSKIDSSVFAYDFRIGYNYFTSGASYSQHNFGLTGQMAKRWKGFYAGALLDFNIYKPSDSVSTDNRYVASVNPFIAKSTGEWNLKLGLTALLDKDYSSSAAFHLYPDLSFGFKIIPAYLGFFAELGGRLEENNPLAVVDMNHCLIPGKSIYTINNTSYALAVRAGFRGESGIDGHYSLSASYSVVNDLLMFSNYVLTDSTAVKQRGNYFIPVTDDADILNVHGDLSGKLAANLWFEGAANYNSYTMNNTKFPWNKPSWDAVLKFKYSLRDKIIAGAGINALGTRKLLVTKESLNPAGDNSYTVDLPAALSFNLSAEYRYTKILSFWVKFNNISFSKYYEWAYFPTQRFIFMAGFTYSL